MAIGPDKTRINITITKELKKWYDEKSDQLGLSTTSFIVMALNQVKEGTMKAEALYREQYKLTDEQFAELVDRQTAAIKEAQAMKYSPLTKFEHSPYPTGSRMG